MIPIMEGAMSMVSECCRWRESKELTQEIGPIRHRLYRSRGTCIWGPKRRYVIVIIAKIDEGHYNLYQEESDSEESILRFHVSKNHNPRLSLVLNILATNIRHHFDLQSIP